MNVFVLQCKINNIMINPPKEKTKILLKFKRRGLSVVGVELAFTKKEVFIYVVLYFGDT